MGVLDDAIREHLELKRKHGAAEEELQRQEEEALGPARRDVAHQHEDEAEPAGAVPAAPSRTTALFDGEDGPAARRRGRGARGGGAPSTRPTQRRQPRAHEEATLLHEPVAEEPLVHEPVAQEPTPVEPASGGAASR